MRHFQHIIDRIAGHTKSWQSKLLSDAGRLVLIKHVLSSIPMHILSAISILEFCLKMINSILANFWGSSDYERKRHWCKWKALCLPIEDGGPGLRDLHDVWKAFTLKKCWMVATSNTL